MLSRLYLPAMGILVLFSGCTTLDRFYSRESGASQLEHSYEINGVSYTLADAISTGVSAPVTASMPITTAPSPAVSDRTVLGAWLNAAAADSVQKCSSFLARLAVQKTTADTSLDILALATAMPLYINQPSPSRRARRVSAAVST